MNHYYDTFPTPVGEFSAAVNEDGALVATAFGKVDALNTRFTAGRLTRDPAKLSAARKEIGEYFTGKRRQFRVKLAPEGTSFQQSVWSALCKIPSGETRTYGQLATQLGRAHASRAVGRANATNPICLVVPCHRVIGANGALTGFAFGTDLKRRLLEHEGAVIEK